VDQLLKELTRVEDADPVYSQAVTNVRADIRSVASPHGNLRGELVASLDARCGAGASLHDVVPEHRAIARPDLHSVATPPTLVRRAMARSDFVVYHILAGGAADLSERDVWIEHLTPGDHTLTGADLAGRTGASGRPCWWTFDEPERALPTRGGSYAQELALAAGTFAKILADGALVELSVPSAAAAPAYFKPTSLEGFAPDTPFRPELSGAPHGRTAPADPQLTGWPEIVSASVAYSDILEEDAEVTLRVLEY
jgi:hypothetical protein